MIDPNTLTAWATVAIALAAFIAVWFEGKRSRFALGVELLFKMDDRFDSPEMRITRKLAAEALLKKENLKDAEDVWDFFETLELMLRRKVLDEEMVWHTFFYWIEGYWYASRVYIAAHQEEEPLTYTGFRDLYERVLAIEKRGLEKKRRSYEPYQPEDIEKFLKEEAALKIN